MRTLADAGVPVGVIVAPVIPQLTDKDIEAVLGAAADHGARFAGYTIVRLPREVAPLFRAWLDAHYPLRAAHVMSIIRDLRGGRDNDGRFGHRMRGQGRYAELIRQRVDIARRRHGLDREAPALDTGRFRPPAAPGAPPVAPSQSQLDLF
jgi:DNA repair photolyase